MAWTIGGGGGDLSSQQIDAVDSIVNLPDGAVPKAIGGELQSSAISEDATEVTSTKDIGAPEVAVRPGSMNIGANRHSSGGENSFVTSTADGDIFYPIWIKEGDVEGFMRIPTGTKQVLAQEPSKADILINPSWQSDPVVDWRVVELTFESDTTITNVVFDVTKNGKDFATSKMGTLTANVEKTIILDDTTLNTPLDAFTGDVYIVSVSSVDGDVRLKGSTANALPFFKIGYFAFIDKPIDPDLRMQRRTTIAGVEQLGYRASVTSGDPTLQGWTDDSTGTATVVAISDPDDGLTTLQILDNDAAGIASISRTLVGDDFQKLFDFGGQVRFLVKVVTEENDLGMVAIVGFSDANDPGWKGGTRGRFMFNFRLAANGNQIIQPEGGADFELAIKNEYYFADLEIIPGTMVANVYADGVFLVAHDFSAASSNANSDNEYSVSSGGTTSAGRECLMRESLLTKFTSLEPIRVNKQQIEANPAVYIPEGVVKDWVVEFPDDDVEFGSTVLGNIPDNGSITLIRVDDSTTFNGQEALKLEGQGVATVAQINTDPGAPDRVYQVSILGDSMVVPIAGTVASEFSPDAKPRLSTTRKADLVLGAEQIIPFDPMLVKGDLWDDSGTIKFWDNTAWIDATITPKSSVYGCQVVFFQTSTPTVDAILLDNYWINPSTQVINVWNGAAWVLNGDQSITNRLFGRTLYTAAIEPVNGTSRAEDIKVLPDGTILIEEDGFFKGNLSLFVDKSGGAGADLSIWVEIKPIATGVYELASSAMSNPIIFDDGGQAMALSGTINALAGDEIRIKIKENAGVATLRTETKVVGLGSVSQYAASLSVFRIGAV